MAIEKDWDKAFLANSKGSAATRDRAWRTWVAVREFAKEKKWNLAPASITPKQARQYIEHRATVVSARCVQLEASHIRRAVAGADREIGDVRDPKNSWSSSRLNVPEGSRLGGKAAADPARYESVRERMPSDIQAAIGLVGAIGLRIKESVMSGDSLAGWSRELAKPESRERGCHIHVIDGSKGGRPRWVFVPPGRVDVVVAAVSAAAASVARHGNVIAAAKLEHALKRFSNCMARLELTGDNSVHGLRRAFAQEQYAWYRESGLGEALALKRLSQDLGHGDGRGRWVFNNYLSGGAGGGD